jgi:site-specific DNA-cytosine methylase
VAGLRAADSDDRNMWPDSVRILTECEAPEALFENVPGLITGSHGYFGTILKDLDEAGYSAVWDCVGAATVSAPHRRDRLWIYAWRRTGWEPKGLSLHAELEEGAWWPRDRVSGLLQELGRGEPIAGAWRRSGLLHDGSVYIVPTASVSTGRTLDGGWPKPMLNILTKPSTPPYWQPYPTPLSDAPVRPVGLTDEERCIFSTPTLLDCKLPKKQEVLDREHDEVRPGRAKPNNLRDQIAVEEGLRTWPTPMSSNWRSGEVSDEVFNRNGRPLQEEVARDSEEQQTWPTPTAALATGGQKSRGGKRSGELLLAGAVKEAEEQQTWPTPKASPSGPDFARAEREGSGGDDLVTAIAKDGERKEWPTPAVHEGGGTDEFLDAMVTKEGDPARFGERAYHPDAKWACQINLSRAVRFPAERENYPTPAPGTHGRGALACVSVVNALLRGETPDIQSLTPDVVLASELGRLGVREVVSFRNGEVIMHDGETRYVTVPEDDGERIEWPTVTLTDARGGRRSTARTEEWESNPGTTLLDATLEAGGEGTEGWEDDLKKKAAPPQLSPDWVEWLMGWPLGWTRLVNGTIQAGMDEWAGAIRMNRWWWREPEGVPRVTRHKADRVTRLKALGNGQVPATTAAAWLLLEATARAIEAGDAEICDLADLFGMG